MPSSGHVQECRPSSETCQRKAHRTVSSERPVLQALQRVIWRGLQLVCEALKGSDGKDVTSRSESPEDSGAERMFYSCHENLEDMSWGEERHQSDTDLRTSTPIRNVYLPQSGLDALIDVKLRAVRKAFQVIIRDAESRRFLKEAGLSILTGLLLLAGKKTEGLTHVWDKLMVFAESPSNWAAITAECQEAGMQTPCFYDLFYEAIVLRLLACSEQVPPVLRTTMCTPWISDSTKKTTVLFHAWAQIRKERELMMRPQGLYYHLCEVRDYVDGEMMWAAFGPKSDGKEFYFLLRGEILSLIQHIFDLDSQTYTSPAMLSVHIFSEWRGCVCRLQEYLVEQQRTDTCQAPQNPITRTPTQGPPTPST